MCIRDSTGTYCREVPDVSADADPYTGYLIYYTGTGTYGDEWQGIGGTSAAAPQWAALMALINADSACAGTPIGFANPALYTVAGSSSYSSALHDITVGNNDYRGTNRGLYLSLIHISTPSGQLTSTSPGRSAASSRAAVPNASARPLPFCRASTAGSSITRPSPLAQTTTWSGERSMPKRRRATAA